MDREKAAIVYSQSTAGLLGFDHRGMPRAGWSMQPLLTGPESSGSARIKGQGRKHQKAKYYSLRWILKTPRVNGIVSMQPLTPSPHSMPCRGSKEVSIRKTYPGSVDIVIKERQPFALWQEAAKSWSILDADGQIITGL